MVTGFLLKSSIIGVCLHHLQILYKNNTSQFSQPSLSKLASSVLNIFIVSQHPEIKEFHQKITRSTWFLIILFILLQLASAWPWLIMFWGRGSIWSLKRGRECNCIHDRMNSCFYVHWILVVFTCAAPKIVH